MLRTRRFKAADDKDIQYAMSDLPANSFRQLIPMGKALMGRELYLIIFELTEEQEQTWQPTFVQPEPHSTNQFSDY